MSANLAAMLYATIAMGLAAMVLPADAFGGNRIRGLAAWFLAALALLFLNDALITFLFMFVILLALAPFAPERRAAFFIIVAPAFPLYVQQYLPFPGINYLTLLDYYRVASFALLFPLLFVPRSRDAPSLAWTLSDSCVVGYVLYTSAMVGEGENFTSGLRFLLDQLLLVAAPYFAISRAAIRRQDVETCLRAFLVASAILAAVAIIATLKRWDFYRYKETLSPLTLPEYRGGFLRIGATINTHSLGFHLAACVVLLEYLKTSMAFGMIRLWGLRAMLLAGLFFTASRGATTALITAAGGYVVLSVRSSVIRWLLVVGMAGAAWIGATWLLSGDSAEFDTYGTFDYRQQLLSTSLRYISEHPFFGDIHFLQSGEFNALVQGQGIIDITNLYLQVALKYGLVGFALFFMPFALTLYRLSFVAHDGADDLGGGGVHRMRSAVAALLIGWLVLIATTSDVGLTLHLGLVLLALGRSLAYKPTQAPQGSLMVELVRTVIELVRSKFRTGGNPNVR